MIYGSIIEHLDFSRKWLFAKEKGDETIFVTQSTIAIVEH